MEKQKLVEYSSSKQFSNRVVSKLTEDQNLKRFKLEKYSNEQYEYFERNDMTKLDAIVAQEGDKPLNESDLHEIMKELIHDYQPPSSNPN